MPNEEDIHDIIRYQPHLNINNIIEEYNKKSN